MTDYRSVRENFASLLRWHLKENGTRPDCSPHRPGKIWKAKEFAAACHVGDPAKPDDGARTVRYWYSATSPSVPPDLGRIERALFGESRAYDDWRRDLRSAQKSALARRDSTHKGRTDSIIEQPKNNPALPQDKDAFDFLAQEGLVDDREEIGVTPYFLHAIWLRCCSPELISSIITPPTGPVDIGGYIAVGEPLVDKLLDQVVFPELPKPGSKGPEFSRLLAEARYHVHVKLRMEASHRRLINVHKNHYSISNEILDGAFAYVSENLKEIASRLELSRRILDALNDELSAHIGRRSGGDPRLVQILGLFLFAIGHDCREIACAERSWRFLKDGLQEDAILRRWSAYSAPFYMHENLEGPPPSIISLFCKS
jgi:hypothetical protein